MKKVYWFSFLIFLIDQITKALALSFCITPIKLTSFFSLTLVFNPGSIWGLGAKCTYILAFLGVLAIIFLILYLKKIHQPTPLFWLSGILIGGIAGNTCDRLFRSYVVDFLDFHIKTWHWPCFNIADIAITFTCFYLVFLLKK